MAARTLQSAQQLGNGLDNQGSRFSAWQGQELFSKASRIAPSSGPDQLPTQWVSGLFFQGKRHQNMKLTAHHPHSQTHLQPPTVELYHTWHHAYMACRHRFTPYWHHTFVPELESGNRAATYTQVSSKYPKHITHSSFLCTWLLAHTHTVHGQSVHINKIPWILGTDITNLIDIAISSETKESIWGTNQLLRLSGRTQFGSLCFGVRIFFLSHKLWYF